MEVDQIKKDTISKKFWTETSNWLDRSLKTIFPEMCQFCRSRPARKRDGYICAACWQKLRLVRRPFCERCGLPFDGELLSTFRCSDCQTQAFAFHAVRSAIVANDFSRKLIHQYKYGRALWLEIALIDLLWEQLKTLELTNGWDMIIPVPLHSTRKREREFNQAERIGRGLAKRLGIPIETGLIKRIVPTDSQTKLSRNERQRNVRKAFVAKKSGAFQHSKHLKNLKHSRVMLIDDVFTTGATTHACAKVLKQLGTKEVWVISVVRGL